MSSEPVDFLSIAKDIKEMNSESAYRVTISRSYYACFHYSQDLASILDKSNEIGGAHASHINKFVNAQNNKAKAIGYKMRQFHGMRVDADYHLDLEIEESKAVLAISMAERIIEDIDKIS